MKRYQVLALAMAVGLLMPTMAMALSMPGPIVQCDGVHCTCKDLVKTAQNILFTGIYLAVFLSAVLFAWAGWKMMTGKSLGDPGAIDNGKKILTNVIIGLIIILAAWLIVNTLFTALVGSKGIGSLCPGN